MQRILRGVLACVLFAVAFSALAAERHSDPDGCFSCHGLPGLEYIDKDGLRRAATILQSDYYGSLHGGVPCKDCHREIDKYPHKPEEGYVDCSESCHVEEPSKGKAFTHKDVVDEFKTSAHGKGHAPGATKEFHGGNRVKEAEDEQNPSCRRCHSNTPYIKDAHLAKFKEEFQHTETECGTCHQGETWRNQYSGHILRRLVGNNFSKTEANAMCIDCHADAKAMEKVKLQDYETKEKKPADYRFQHATDSYGKTLHGRFLSVGDESGADCIDCHAPKGFRHGVQRDEEATASTHPDKLHETCSQGGCHGYAKAGINDGFVKTDQHDVAMLRLDVMPSLDEFLGMDSAYGKAVWMLGPLAALFALGSLLWYLLGGRGGINALVGHDEFQREMLGVNPHGKSGWWARFMGQSETMAGANTRSAPVVATPIQSTPSMTLLYASQTGNGEGIAKDLAARAEASGFTVKLMDMLDYDLPSMVNERLLFIVASTHGEGEPPHAAARLHAYLYSEAAPRLENLKFGVLALGDSSYKHFCKAGKDFDAFLLRLGASHALHRVDADADFEEPAAEWMEAVLATYAKTFSVPYTPTPIQLGAQVGQAAGKVQYSKTNPYPATVLRNINLNGVGSAKETRHVEIDLGDSGLIYEAGDALGVYPKNNPAYVEALLATTGYDGYTEVTLGKETVTLREAFFNRLDITALSRVLVEKYAGLAEGEGLADLLDESDEARFNDYAWGRHIIDLVADYPLKDVPPQEFVNLLRRIPPRLYSIASSMKAVGNQVHLTVGAVRYHAHGLDREGVCSTFLAGRLGREEKLGVFVQPNKHFRPPADPKTPAIMVGPGTGIAPFRSFVQEREATGAKGKNWLFFGDQRQAVDYLYADEWEDKRRRGVLTRLDLAFSRDQAEKIYVQTRMLENAKELYGWLQEGAHFYVCGDASRMAHDVHEALRRIVSEQGDLSRERAEAYLKQLADSGRYQRDVY
ncbi:assimilatory sulfite reductase (NADPH) flavoprotein subunit [Methylomagnum sp.]